MYEELIKRLREYSTARKGEIAELTEEAADAIEELTGFVQEAERDRDEYRERLDKANDAIEELTRRCEQFQYMPPPAWIPVTERLPEEWKPVLCYYEYFRYGEYNCMFRTIDRGYYGDGRWGGEAGQGHRNKVLAWMPLPTPPADPAKEEE